MIGNPPYQKPGPPDRDRGRRLGYVGHLKNLYLMFIEAAIQVAACDGCVTLVVPLSIVFGREKVFQNIRRGVELMALRISIRTYDNRPQPLFPRLPWLKGPDKANDNRQRATILAVLKGTSDKAEIFSGALIRLSANNRIQTLRQASRGQAQTTHIGQWTQAPTRVLAELLNTMRHDYPDFSKQKTFVTKT